MRKPERKTLKKARALRKQMTQAEIILWQHLRKRQLDGHKFRRQVTIGPFIADFACIDLKLVIEVDGATHSSGDQLRHDAARTSFLEQEGWLVHRIWNSDVYDNLEGVLAGLGHVARDSEAMMQ